MIENDQDYTFLTCFSKGWVERWNWVLFVRLNSKILRICLVLFKQRVFAYKCNVFTTIFEVPAETKVYTPYNIKNMRFEQEIIPLIGHWKTVFLE